MEATDRTLGELIKKMRTAEGLTQSELAMEVYSDVQSIGRWERGYRRVSWDRFLEVAKACGYTVEIEVKGGAE